MRCRVTCGAKCACRQAAEQQAMPAAPLLRAEAEVAAVMAGGSSGRPPVAASCAPDSVLRKLCVMKPAASLREMPAAPKGVA